VSLLNTPRCFRGIYGSITPSSLISPSTGTLACSNIFTTIFIVPNRWLRTIVYTLHSILFIYTAWDSRSFVLCRLFNALYSAFGDSSSLFKVAYLLLFDYQAFTEGYYLAIAQTFIFAFYPYSPLETVEVHTKTPTITLLYYCFY